MAVSQHRDLSGYIRAHEGQHQLRTAIMYARGDGARHELAYEASHRHFHHLHPDASIAIRRLARPSFKSAISYTFEKDTRDNTYTTTLGTYFRSFTELAGFGGDTSYFKTETQASLADVMVDGWSWSLGAKFGYMMPLDGKPACLSDRFMLGGPTCIRMFRLNSLGPKYKCTCHSTHSRRLAWWRRVLGAWCELASAHSSASAVAAEAARVHKYWPTCSSAIKYV